MRVRSGLRGLNRTRIRIWQTWEFGAVATTIVELEALFKEIGWKYKLSVENGNPKEGYVYAGFPTKEYKDKDGDNYIGILFTVQENGELIKVVVPKLYSCINTAHRRAFFEVAIRKTFEKKLCFFDYDHRDGEIRMILDLPLEDASITIKQIKRIVHSMVRLIDGNDAVVRAAVEEGRLPLIDYKSDIQHEISKMDPDQQLELLIDIKRRNSSKPS